MALAFCRIQIPLHIFTRDVSLFVHILSSFQFMFQSAVFRNPLPTRLKWGRHRELTIRDTAECLTRMGVLELHFRRRLRVLRKTFSIEI